MSDFSINLDELISVLINFSGAVENLKLNLVEKITSSKSVTRHFNLGRVKQKNVFSVVVVELDSQKGMI